MSSGPGSSVHPYHSETQRYEVLLFREEEQVSEELVTHSRPLYREGIELGLTLAAGHKDYNAVCSIRPSTQPMQRTRSFSSPDDISPHPCPRHFCSLCCGTKQRTEQRTINTDWPDYKHSHKAESRVLKKS